MKLDQLSIIAALITLIALPASAQDPGLPHQATGADAGTAIEAADGPDIGTGSRGRLRPSQELLRLDAICDEDPIPAPAPGSNVLTGEEPFPAPAPGSDDDDSAEVTAEDLALGVLDVINQWSTVGWLAGILALINLLLAATRFPPVDQFLTDSNLKWLKPLIAVILGGALGGFSVALATPPDERSTPAAVIAAIVAGISAGLGSVGFHQLIDQVRKR